MAREVAHPELVPVRREHLIAPHAEQRPAPDASRWRRRLRGRGARSALRPMARPGRVAIARGAGRPLRAYELAAITRFTGACPIAERARLLRTCLPCTCLPCTCPLCARLLCARLLRATRPDASSRAPVLRESRRGGGGRGVRLVPQLRSRGRSTVACDVLLSALRRRVLLPGGRGRATPGHGHHGGDDAGGSRHHYQSLRRHPPTSPLDLPPHALPPEKRLITTRAQRIGASRRPAPDFDPP